jgi:hypothetical protein
MDSPYHFALNVCHGRELARDGHGVGLNGDVDGRDPDLVKRVDRSGLQGSILIDVLLCLDQAIVKISSFKKLQRIGNLFVLKRPHGLILLPLMEVVLKLKKIVCKKNNVDRIVTSPVLNRFLKRQLAVNSKSVLKMSSAENQLFKRND